VTLQTIICTVRHAQSTYGAEKRYAGSVDVPLSDRGSQDCLLAAQALAGRTFDVVVTSTMVRAMETARLLGYDDARCVRTELCRERRYGILEGRTWDEARSLEPPILFIEVGGDLHSVNPSGGEPFEDVWQRAKDFYRFVLDRGQGRSVLVVSHGVFLQMFHGVLRGRTCIESLADYPSSLRLYEFRVDGGRLVEESETPLLVNAQVGF
jgi:2,3-bisphosphoglycerate-dependent phosphoglycerate mutase